MFFASNSFRTLIASILKESGIGFRIQHDEYVEDIRAITFRSEWPAEYVENGNWKQSEKLTFQLKVLDVVGCEFLQSLILQDTVIFIQECYPKLHPVLFYIHPYKFSSHM